MSYLLVTTNYVSLYQIQTVLQHFLYFKNCLYAPFWFPKHQFLGKECSIYSVKYCKSLHCDLHSFYLAAGTGALPVNVTGIFYCCFWSQHFLRSLQEFHTQNQPSISGQSRFIYLIYYQNLHYESFYYWEIFSSIWIMVSDKIYRSLIRSVHYCGFSSAVRLFCMVTLP
jgi:hypothetical protein